jgi:hypothetical protein
MLRAAAADYWATLETLEVGSTGLSGLELRIHSDASVASNLGAIGRTVDVTTGMVSVRFAGRSGPGGESVLVASGGSAFTFDDLGIPRVSPYLLEGGSDELIVSHVPVGTTEVEISGAPEGSECAAVLTSVGAWTVLDKAITRIAAQCTLLPSMIRGTVRNAAGSPVSAAVVAVLGS